MARTTDISTGSEKLRTELNGSSVLVTISNPPANTWDAESLQALEHLVAVCETNTQVRSLIITGSGDKFFSAGADLKLFASGDKTMAANMANCFGRAFEALAAFSGPTIAAINGYAMGGGLECALACDIRIAEEQARMALPEASVGLLPCGGGTQNLAQVVGEGWAKRMILCGERILAAKALDIGLLEEVVSKGKSVEAALTLAKSVENQSPAAVTASKHLIQQARLANSAYAKERKAFVDLFDTQDQTEGVNAFLEKRPPLWQHT